ncbi:MAG TPA: glycosyltransferase family 4 protein [Candidatus Omnitrophota bacterium]|nr:glycosyltransferase family 4 protein [Candidatus Omnitrophota bacterium]
MNILIIHNSYQIPGGEDEVVRSEKGMLEQFGHKVVLYARSNDEIEKFSLPAKVQFVVRNSQWSGQIAQDIRSVIRKEKIQLVHIHNTFLVIGPAVYQACRDEGVPVVQTLHNYRFLCPNGLFYRDGHICNDCLKFGRQSAIVNRCWRNSFSASLMITKTVDTFHSKGILQDGVQHYIALSNFSRQLYIENGFSADKISVKPNFLSFDPGQEKEKGDFALFVGGFFAYKGVETLVRAWRDIGDEFSLKMIGDGPLFSKTQSMKSSNVELFGRRSFQETLGYLRRARLLIVPSECYENFPRVIVEAFACGVPVIGSDAGVIPELVREGVTGLLFKAGDPHSLVQKAVQLVGNKALSAQMGQNVRREFELKYTEKRNYEELMAIYHKSIVAYRGGRKI